MKEKPKHFPNGFYSWAGTYYEIVVAITLMIYDEDIDEDGILYKQYDEQGQYGLYELAIEITDKFELEYEGAIWGADFDYDETLENFLNLKL